MDLITPACNATFPFAVLWLRLFQQHHNHRLLLLLLLFLVFLIFLLFLFPPPLPPPPPPPPPRSSSASFFFLPFFVFLNYRTRPWNFCVNSPPHPTSSSCLLEVCIRYLLHLPVNLQRQRWPIGIACIRPAPKIALTPFLMR